MKSFLIALSIGCAVTLTTPSIRARAKPIANAAQARDEALEQADRLENEADSRRSKREFKKAAELLTKALALREQKLGRDHPQVARTSFLLAEIQFGTADYANAETHYRNAIRIIEKTGITDDPDLLRALRRLAGVLIALEKSDEGLEIQEKLGDFSPAVGIAQVGFLKPRAVKLERPRPPTTSIPVSRVRMRVYLLVDEEGKVISATSSLIHEPFTGAALDAARRSKFKPLYYHGKPVKMSGYIDYRFVRTFVDLP